MSWSRAALSARTGVGVLAAAAARATLDRMLNGLSVVMMVILETLSQLLCGCELPLCVASAHQIRSGPRRAPTAARNAAAVPRARQTGRRGRGGGWAVLGVLASPTTTAAWPCSAAVCLFCLWTEILKFQKVSNGEGDGPPPHLAQHSTAQHGTAAVRPPWGSTASRQATQATMNTPARILSLPQHVVDQIAAGEVVSRVSSAVKELLENSIDAGATTVQIVLKGGGLTQLTITDNGRGIAREDLPVVCRRHTTSKLTQFEDLRTIRTYGFRGEALASISQVARVTITSRPRNTECAFTASYDAGECTKAPAPIAGNPGTTILVQDMFQRNRARREALRENEELRHTLDVVSKYAVHHGRRSSAATSGGRDEQGGAGVAIVCRKAQSKTASVHTAQGASQLDNIRALYSSTVANELLAVDLGPVHVGGVRTPEDAEDAVDPVLTQPTSLQVHGYVSNANYSNKHATYIFFINDRLVESSGLRRALAVIFAELLPRGMHPFVYLALQLTPEHIDVNVSPTKAEVAFLNEPEVVHAVEAAVRSALKGANSSRTFVQTTLSSGASAGASQTSPPSSASVTDDTPSSKDLSDDFTPDDREGETDDDSPLHPVRTPSLRSYALKSSGASAATAELARPAAASSRRGGTKRSAGSSRSAASTRRPEKLIRTDSQTQGLERFGFVPGGKPRESRSVSPPSPRRGEDQGEVDDDDLDSLLDGDDASAHESAARPTRGHSQRGGVDDDDVIVAGTDALQLTSVKNLWASIVAKTDKVLTSELKRMVFVGLVNSQFMAAQVDTRLLLVDFRALARAMLFQRVIEGFGRFRGVQLAPRVEVGSILASVVSSAASSSVQDRVQTLGQRADMLKEYFGLVLIADDADGLWLEEVPVLLAGHVPTPAAVVRLLVALTDGTSVDWDEEEACFKSLANAFADSYAPFVDGEQLFPELRSLLVPVGFQEHFRELTRTEILYKVFERC